MSSGTSTVDEDKSGTISLSEVNTLRRAGLIPVERYLDAVYRCREPAYWTRWALRALLALGVGHLLAGIVFFFAYNWDDLSSFAKFGILEVGILTSVGLALIVNIDRVGGQVLLIAASVLVGTLLAVIGQVYQTGADAYELFTVWAFLIIPWVVASRSAAHWFVWLVVVYAALNLYAYQVLIPLEVLSTVQLNSLLGVTAAAALIAREGAVLKGFAWLDVRWTRLVLAFAGLAIVFQPAVAYVLEWDAEIIGALTFVALVASFAFVYVRAVADFAVVAITTGFVALFLMAVGWRVLEETIGLEWNDTFSMVSVFALFTLWCAAMTAGTVKTLGALRQYMGSGGVDA
jgi:uncharacterized membrane protein